MNFCGRCGGDNVKNLPCICISVDAFKAETVNLMRSVQMESDKCRDTLVGNVLDHWENTPNDVKEAMREDSCGVQLDALLAYMSDPELRDTTPQPAQADTTAGAHGVGETDGWKHWSILERAICTAIDAGSIRLEDGKIVPVVGDGMVVVPHESLRYLAYATRGMQVCCGHGQQVSEDEIACCGQPVDAGEELGKLLQAASAPGGE